MKNIFLPLATFVLLVVLTSCSKVSHNGYLDGKWRLRACYSKENPTDASYTIYKNKEPDSIYWSFQLNLLSITSPGNLNGYSNETLARFAHEGDRLNITQTYIHFRESDSLLVDHTDSLVRIGLRSNTARFRIVSLSSSRMVLCSDMDSLLFTQLR